MEYVTRIFGSLVSRYTWRMLVRNLYVWKRFLLPSFIGNFGEPFLYLLAIGFGLGTLVSPDALGGQDYAHFIAPGLMLSTAMYTATFECTFGSFTRMKTLRIFEGILTTPLRIEEVVAGEIWFATIKGMTGSLVVLLVTWLFGLVEHWQALLALPAALVLSFLFASLAEAVSALAPSYDFFSYFFTIVVAPMFLFSGIFFPLENVPPWVGAVAWVFPLTHAVNLTRPAFLATTPPHLAADALWLLLVALLTYALAVVLMRRRVIV